MKHRRELHHPPSWSFAVSSELKGRLYHHGITSSLTVPGWWSVAMRTASMGSIVSTCCHSNEKKNRQGLEATYRNQSERWVKSLVGLFFTAEGTMEPG